MKTWKVFSNLWAFVSDIQRPLDGLGNIGCIGGIRLLFKLFLFSCRYLKLTLLELMYFPQINLLFNFKNVS